MLALKHGKHSHVFLNTGAGNIFMSSTSSIVIHNASAKGCTNITSIKDFTTFRIYAYSESYEICCTTQKLLLFKWSVTLVDARYTINIKTNKLDKNVRMILNESRFKKMKEKYPYLAGLQFIAFETNTFLFRKSLWGSSWRDTISNKSKRYQSQ